MAYGQCVFYISRLSKGTHRDFSYGEVWTDPKHVTRVDPLLMERASTLIALPQPTEEKKPESVPHEWYKGTAQGSFDRQVKEVDLRGSRPSVMLQLTAGGKEIECICREEHIEEIRTSLNRRVRVDGAVYYDGKAGLPRRIDVSTIVPMPQSSDFTKWRGSFETFEPLEWEEVG